MSGGEWSWRMFGRLMDVVAPPSRPSSAHLAMYAENLRADVAAGRKTEAQATYILEQIGGVEHDTPYPRDDVPNP